MIFFKKIYLTIINISSSLESWFLLIVRLFWGFLFFQTGNGKLKHLENVSDYFGTLGIPFPELSAFLLAWAETIGGICLMVGIASRLISLPLIFAMFIAFITAHLESIKQMIDDPNELLRQGAFTFLLASLMIFIFGPGKYSFDYLIERLMKKGK